VNSNILVFWELRLRKLTDVSKEPAASVFTVSNLMIEVQGFFETLGLIQYMRLNFQKALILKNVQNLLSQEPI
jgi:hypothetical protein